MPKHLRGLQSAQVNHPKAFGLYDYAVGPRWNPQAPAEVFMPRFATPVQSLNGMATFTRSNRLRIFQRPQVYVNRAVTRVGIGGIVGGGMTLTPLIDPNE